MNVINYNPLNKVHEMTGILVNHVEPVSGGGNNKIYKVICPDGKQMALKFYSINSTSSDLERLKREYEGLLFLRKKGECQVPSPMAVDHESICALFDWIDGEKVNIISLHELNSVVEFIQRLKRYSRDDDARLLSHASDNALNMSCLVEQIYRRLDRLSQVHSHVDLRHFLDEMLKPYLADLIQATKRSYKNEFEKSLPYETAILSPSDFGFHNILRSNQSLTFIDFEYFGWEDPAALLAHFLWHPGMNLTEEHKSYFSLTMLNVFKDDPTFEVRFKLLFPLIGLVWVLILLNEFIPALWQRRLHAGGVLSSDFYEKTEQQLQKAKEYFFRITKVNYTC